MQGFAGWVNCPPSPPGTHEPGTELPDLSPYGGAGRARDRPIGNDPSLKWSEVRRLSHCAGVKLIKSLGHSLGVLKAAPYPGKSTSWINKYPRETPSEGISTMSLLGKESNERRQPRGVRKSIEPRRDRHTRESMRLKPSA
jgi:hypothetical protein